MKRALRPLTCPSRELDAAGLGQEQHCNHCSGVRDDRDAGHCIADRIMGGKHPDQKWTESGNAASDVVTEALRRAAHTSRTQLAQVWTEAAENSRREKTKRRTRSE